MARWQPRASTDTSRRSRTARARTRGDLSSAGARDRRPAIAIRSTSGGRSAAGRGCSHSSTWTPSPSRYTRTCVCTNRPTNTCGAQRCAATGCSYRGGRKQQTPQRISGAAALRGAWRCPRNRSCGASPPTRQDLWCVGVSSASCHLAVVVLRHTFSSCAGAEQTPLVGDTPPEAGVGRATPRVAGAVQPPGRCSHQPRLERTRMPESATVSQNHKWKEQ
jgi:hypothetical protein